MLHLDVTSKRRGDAISRTAKLKADGSSAEIRVDYTVRGGRMDAAPNNFDGFVFCTILHAMQKGQALKVHGPMTRRALCNLEEFQLAWQRWKPETYRHIDIIPDEVVTQPSKAMRPGAAIAAFSGGVDATFTTIRHCLRLADTGSHDVQALMIVQGFDIGVDNDDFFAKAVDRILPLTERLGVELRFVKTNSRTLWLQSWEDSHAAELACCLHQFSGEFEFGLIGSTKSYDSLILPYGSNPATDHLLSGGALTIVHDGAGFSRTDKTEILSRHGFAVPHLRVCHEGKLQYKNCGKCEKCVRTYLNFLAAGNPNPACFDKPVDLSLVARLRAKNDAQLGELTSILDHARKKGIEGAWLKDLQQVISAYAPVSDRGSAANKAYVKTKRVVAAGLDRVGLKKPIKRAMHRMHERADSSSASKGA